MVRKIARPNTRFFVVTKKTFGPYNPNEWGRVVIAGIEIIFVRTVIQTTFTLPAISSRVSTSEIEKKNAVRSLFAETMEREDGPADGVDSSIYENVLRLLNENVRLTTTAILAMADDGDNGNDNDKEDDDNDDDDDDDAIVAANVRSCLAERVVPTVVVDDRLWRLRRDWQRRTRGRLHCSEQDGRIAAAARRTQIRLMGVRSAYADGAYYASETPHVSRTVEELWLPWSAAVVPVVNENTYTVGTVLYDDGDTGACYLHGLVDPRSRVAVDCGLLTAILPRHRSTVKMYSALRTGPDGCTPVLVLRHFQTFSSGAVSN